MSEEIKMFEEAKKIIDQYFKFLRVKVGEDAAVLYSVYEDKGKIEVDLIIGDESEKVLGIRFLNKKKEIIYDLIKKNLTDASIKTDQMEEIEDRGKCALKFHLNDNDYQINHDFLFYSKNGKLKKDITYAEMIPKDYSDEDTILTFVLDDDLFHLQCQF